MGYTTRNSGLITDYWPDEADNSFYIAALIPAIFTRYFRKM